MKATNGAATIEKPLEQPKVTTIEIPAMNIHMVGIEVTGVTPLIMHKWDEKAKEQMRSKQAKKATTGRAVREPEKEFEAATYFLDAERTRYAFPVVAFKAAMTDGAVATGAKKTETRRAFHISADANTLDGQMVEIIAPIRRMREDMVRVGMGAADLRYRPEFPEWKALLKFHFDPLQTSVEQLCKLLNQAGFSTGVGEWRPQKGGSYGQFSITGIKEIKG